MLNNLYKILYSKIRKIDSKRILVFTPSHSSSAKYLKDLWLPNDRYIMVEWHMFAGGMKKRFFKKYEIKRGLQKQFEYIKKYIKIAKDFEKEKHIYTWVGAIRFNNYLKHNKTLYPKELELKFAKFFVNELKTNNIPFAVNADTHYFDIKTKKVLNKDVLKLLFAN